MKPAIPPPRAGAQIQSSTGAAIPAAKAIAAKPSLPPTTPAPGVASKASPTPTGGKPGAPAAANGKAGVAANANGKAAVKKVIQPPVVQPQGDATFGENTYVFVPDVEQCYIPAKVVMTFKQGDDSGEVELMNGERVTLRKQQTKDCLLMDSQSLETIDNMVEFRVLNEASLLHNLRMRYYQDEIYTTIGDILVSVNPFKLVEIYTPDVMDLYIRRKTKAPHVFRVADTAFRAMEETRKAQSCIVAGESGAGKTEATKVFLQYLAEVSVRNEKILGAKGPTNEGRHAQNSPRNDDGETRPSLQEKILEANPLLEAFGNAKTVRNDNSSRFGKWIEVCFDYSTSTIVGGSITSYLLEKTRVVFVTEGERNYHIFYQLVAGASLDKSLRNKYCLSNAATDYHYLNQSSCVQVEEINDTRGWHHTEKAMEVVGIGQKAKEVYATLAGILHLGNVNFGVGDKAVISGSSSNDSLDFAAQCLGFKKDDLERALAKRDVSVRGEKIFKDNNPFQAGLQRDGLAKAVYGLLFDWLLNAVNQSLRTKLMEEDADIKAENLARLQNYEKALVEFNSNHKKFGAASGPKPPEVMKPKLVSVGVLDIFGFESFKRNSFEQLCINYCNEKLQGHFNSFVFTLEQSVYAAEGLDVSQIEFKDNSLILECLELKKKGILSLIDEENAMPNASDASLLRKVLDVNADLVKKPDMNSIRTNSDMANVFIVVHYAGNVGYSVEGFLEKNKDELAPELTALLENSQREFILDLHETSLMEDSERMKKLVGGGENVSSPGNSRRQSASSGAEKKKQSLGAKFKEQLTLLMNTLNGTSPHFIRCVKPNMEKVPEVFTAQMVLSQLRYSGLLEVCRIRQNGYPVQKSFDDFAFRYAPLCVPPPQKRGDHYGVSVALERQSLIPEKKLGMWQIGKTKVFMRQPVFNGLERARDAKLKVFVRHMQRVARGFVERRKFRRYKILLSNLRKALGSTTESVLEKAILDSGSLPYNGVHLVAVQKAHEALSRLRALTKARKMIADAVQAKELSAIQQALLFGDEVGLSKEETIYRQAKEMASGIIQEREMKQSLRAAVQARNLELIKQLIARASQCTLVDVSADIAEALSMQQRLEHIDVVAKQMESITMMSGGATDATTDEVMKLVTILVELGAKDHPAVLQGETFAKRQAEVSAAHKKRVVELKSKLKQAAESNNLDELVVLEREAVQMGMDKDVDVIPHWVLRAKLEKIREAESNLSNASHALVAKSELAEGVSESDIDSFEKLLGTLSSVIPPDASSMVKATDLIVLTKKQIMAKKKLEQVLQSLKENPNQPETNEEMKQAVMDAQSLGMQDDTARRGQALLHLKTIAAEEKREMRRRSVLNTGQLAAAAREAAAELDEVPEQPWLLDDEDENLENIPTSLYDADGNLAPPPGLSKGPALSKQTSEGRAALVEKRMEVANSTEWNEILRASSSDLYRFEGFLGLRTDQDFTEHDLSEKKKKRAEGKCVHTNQLIPKSILKLDTDELNEEAIKIFKSVLGWAGDQNAQFPQTLAVSVLKNGLQLPALRDEIYCQLLKQLSENPAKESEDRVWLLLCLCTEMFGPSKEFLRYLVNFFLRHYADQGMYGNYAKWCAYQLSATEKLGPSPFQPEVKDVNLYTTRPPVIIRVHLIYRVLFEHMSWADFPVWPDQDVGFVEKMIAKSQHIPPQTARVSGLFLKDIELEHPRALPRPVSPADAVTPPQSPGQQNLPLQIRLSAQSISNESNAAASPTGAASAAQKKKTFFASVMGRGRTESSMMIEEPIVVSSTSRDGSDAGDVPISPPLNRESKRKTLTSVSSKLGALSKSFRMRKSNSEAETDSGGDDGLEKPSLGSRSFRMSKKMSFKVKTSSGKKALEGDTGSVKGESQRQQQNHFVAVGAASGGMTSYSNQGDPNAAHPEITSQQVSRVPPPPFAPWPLPRGFFLGDVFLRLVSQDRLPFLTYQRKMFIQDIQPDKPTFIQIMQDVVNNRLPIQDQYQILDLACTAAVRAAVARKQPAASMTTREALLQHGFMNYIPPNWAYGVHETYWSDAAVSYLSAPPGNSILEMGEIQLYERYLFICQQQYLFGASLFSVIHKDLPEDFVAAVNSYGLHILTNDGVPICVGIISFQEMIKFGASSTFIWVSVQPDAVARLSSLFQNEEDLSKGVLYLHTQQAREIYSLLIDYSYWFRHGDLKDV